MVGNQRQEGQRADAKGKTGSFYAKPSVADRKNGELMSKGIIPDFQNWAMETPGAARLHPVSQLEAYLQHHPNTQGSDIDELLRCVRADPEDADWIRDVYSPGYEGPWFDPRTGL